MMKTKEQQAKEYAAGIPHYQDRRQHAANDFMAGLEAAEMWRTDKENMPDNGFVLVLYGETPMFLSRKYAKGQDVVKYWKPMPKMP